MDTTDKILKAFEIMIDKRLGELKYDRTIKGKIVEKSSTGYLIAIEGNKVNVKSNDTSYKRGDIVKVHIPLGNMSQAYIENTSSTTTITSVETDLSPIYNSLSSLKADILTVNNNLSQHPIIKLVDVLPDDAVDHPEIVYMIPEPDYSTPGENDNEEISPEEEGDNT